MIRNKKILYICPRFFYPPNDGAKIVFYNTIKHLSETNDIDFIGNISLEDIPYLDYVKNFFGTVRYITHDVSKQNLWKFFISILQRKSYFFLKYYDKNILEYIDYLYSENNYDIVWIESAYMTIFAEYIKEQYPNSYIVSRSHNTEGVLLERISQGENNFFYKKIILRESFFWKKIESDSLKYVDKLFTITDFDRDYFVKNNFISDDAIQVLSPGVDLEKYSFSYNLPQEKNLVFIGAMNYFPNIQAIHWFINEVFSKITDEFPDLKLYIIGKNAPKEIYNLASERIIIKSAVNSDVEYYNLARIFIVPLLSGSGLKLKVINALAMGKTVLSTKVGTEGIPVKNAIHLFEYDKAEDWIKVIRDNISNDEILQDIGKNAHKLVIDNFNWDKIFTNLTL